MRIRTRWLLWLTILLLACGEPAESVAPTEVPTLLTSTAAPIPTAAPTPPPQRLVLCTTEPAAANPFLPSQSGYDLLALFYQQPIERNHYQWEARLVERLPSLSSGDVMTRTVSATMGTRYADKLSLVHQVTTTEAIELPQLVVTFTLKPDLYWSDGVPITTKDAMFGYHLAQAPEARGRWRELAERTARFVAVDERRVRWEGIPGYLSADYPGFLFPLQPAHRWQGQTLAAILRDRTPPATGAFRIVSWEAHREVRLEPNPHYSGPAPVLQEVIIRFPQQSYDRWPALLIDGTCDIILPDPILSTPWEQWARLGASGEALVWADAAPTVLRLDLNLGRTEVAAQDVDEPLMSPLQDPAVRQALNACINRQRLTQTLPAEALVEATGFVSPNHPAYVPPARPAYDPARAKELLRGAGWQDSDGDGVREAHNTVGFADGTVLSATLHFASQYFAIAAHVTDDLEACGFDIDLQPLDARQLYTPGSTSPLFGRQFDMALLGWSAELPQACGAWLSTRIPAADQAWHGENFAGFASDAYDRACKTALTAIDPAQRDRALQEAQAQLNVELPTLFLAWRPFWFVTRPKVQGLRPDVSAHGTIWNIEALHITDGISSD